MAKNAKLKTVILEKDFTQREVSKRARIPESVLSHHIHGRWVFSRSEKEAIAEVLQVDSREIFPEAGA